MFRFLKRNDSEVITPEVVDVPVMTIQSNIAMAMYGQHSYGYVWRFCFQDIS